MERSATLRDETLCETSDAFSNAPRASFRKGEDEDSSPAGPFGLSDLCESETKALETWSSSRAPERARAGLGLACPRARVGRASHAWCFGVCPRAGPATRASGRDDCPSTRMSRSAFSSASRLAGGVTPEPKRAGGRRRGRGGMAERTREPRSRRHTRSPSPRDVWDDPCGGAPASDAPRVASRAIVAAGDESSRTFVGPFLTCTLDRGKTPGAWRDRTLARARRRRRGDVHDDRAAGRAWGPQGGRGGARPRPRQRPAHPPTPQRAKTQLLVPTRRERTD